MVMLPDSTDNDAWRMFRIMGEFAHGFQVCNCFLTAFAGRPVELGAPPGHNHAVGGVDCLDRGEAQCRVLGLALGELA